MSRSRRIALAAVCTALALLLSYVESLFPLPVPVPGVKLGLANTVVLVLLLKEDRLSAFFVSVVRVMLSAALFSGFSGFLYALSGSLVSFFIMLSALRVSRLGSVGVSVLGGVSHSLAQLCVAVLVTHTPQLFSYAGVLMAAGTASGVLTGLIAGAVAKLLPGFTGMKKE